MNRRTFFKAAGATAALQVAPFARAVDSARPTPTELEDRATATPLLDLPAALDPLVIERIDVLERDGFFVVRVRAADGAEGLAVGNELHMGSLWPVLTQKLRGFCIGRDASAFERWLPELLRHGSNYKLQGMGLWLPLANLEFALLDLIGRRTGRPVHALLGGLRSPRIEVYEAFDDRERDPEESVRRMVDALRVSGARAAKFKVGGRMSRNADSLPGRTEALIPLARQALGRDFTLYADSNGSYDVPEAIRIGRILQEHRIGFFEEPVPFDRFGDTLEVARALEIPIAGGEQDASLYNMAWMLAHGALQVAQPDLFYFGGMVRSRWVARMAEAVGADCVPHISGTGTGYVYMLHFAAAIPNAGPFHEFKGGLPPGLPVTCATSSLKAEHGKVTVPTGPGWGLTIDPEWLSGARMLGA